MVNNNDITNTTGTYIIEDTTLHSGFWHLILVVSTATFEILDDDAVKLGAYSGKTYSQGTQLPGSFKNIKLTSGEIIAYA